MKSIVKKYVPDLPLLCKKLILAKVDILLLGGAI
jgi:hypothetical protein